MWFYHGRRSFVEFRSGSEDRNCANKATVLDQWMYTYTQNRILHHEDCPARSLNPWKRGKTMGEILSRLDLPVRWSNLNMALMRENGIFVLSPLLNILQFWPIKQSFLAFGILKRKKGSYESMNHSCSVLEQTVYPETELLYVTI